MVKRATGQTPSRNKRTRSRSGLGPGGQGLFSRVFGSRPTEQTPVKRQEATSIAVASGKGGTGKSFVATNLAVVYHQRNNRVTLTDCDFGMACDHLLMGVSPALTLQHVLAGRAVLSDVQVETPSGPTLVPGGSGVLQMANLNDNHLLTLGRLLSEVAAINDIMILDVGAGIAPANVLTLLSADEILIVTQPEIAALTDAYAVIKICAQLRAECKFNVIVNRVVVAGQGEKTFEKLAKVSTRHTGAKLNYLGEIGEDPTVTQRRLRQQPVTISDPDGATAQAMHRIADRLDEIADPLGVRVLDRDSCVEARFREHRLFLT